MRTTTEHKDRGSIADVGYKSTGPASKALESLKAILSQEVYIRERLEPRPGDPFYLHLSDLVLALKEIEIAEGSTILDYGAGSSPYRTLFANCHYRRADIIDSPGVEYVINSTGVIPEQSMTFDVVLSTQVLEHLVDPYAYLSECFRLLKPGGRLILSTHGTYEDHGCPLDFRRWTAHGLKHDLEKVGFEVLSIQKLTTGPRMLMFLIECFTASTRYSRRTVYGALYWLAKKGLDKLRPWIHKQLDRRCDHNRIVPFTVPHSDMYICLLSCSRRPYAETFKSKTTA